MFDSPAASSAVSTRVLLARHAETVWNVQRKFQGHSDSPLSQRGLEQAERLADRLSVEQLSAVYASDLGRARVTAELVAARHSLRVGTHPGLREIDTGELTGLQRAEAQAVPRWAALLDTYRTRPWEMRMPRGETVAEVQGRGLAAINEIIAEHKGEAILIVSHHVVVETVIAHALGIRLEELWLPHRGGNCFLSEIEIVGEVWRPELIYDGAHIGELVGLDGAKGESRGAA